MKRILILLMALMPMVVMSAAKPNKQIVVLSCDLHCQGCCDKIMKNIAFEKGVKDIVCNLKTKTVTVTYDANKTDVPTLLKAFEKIGKPAQVKGDESQKKENPDTDADTGATLSTLCPKVHLFCQNVHHNLAHIKNFLYLCTRFGKSPYGNVHNTHTQRRTLLRRAEQ